jgi:acyl-CoA-binding protein
MVASAAGVVHHTYNPTNSRQPGTKMSDLDQRFEQAQEDVQGLTSRPSNDELLELYALYKQGTEGDVSGKRPGMTNFKGRAKYDAWKEKKGMSGDDAKEAYISLVERLLG